MSNELYLLLTIFISAVVTLITRAAPFILFGKQKKTPKYIEYIGRYLPPAIMVMLVIYSLRGISVTRFPFGVSEVVAVGAVCALHQWKRNAFVSIVGGTVVYMIFVQMVFG